LANEFTRSQQDFSMPSINETNEAIEK